MRRLRIGLAIALIYVGLAAIHTWPLLKPGQTKIAADAGDPSLNALILWWDATQIPFSADWWNGPQFYPAKGVSAFTENLVGISLLSTPISWLTGNPITTYNLALFLTWPLSAIAMYALVLFLTNRQDAAFLAGLAYGFTPYRTTELSHIQMLSSYWMPACLLGLHGFLERRRHTWLGLFGVAWLLLSLSNGHFMLFTAVLIALWLAFFCCTRQRWSLVTSVLAAWALASLPLILVLAKYRAIHEYFGFQRSVNAILAFSARPHSWFEVSNEIWFWRSFLPLGRDNLFPGATAIAIVLFAGLALRLRARPELTPEAWPRRSIRVGLEVGTLISLGAVLIILAVGPYRSTILGIRIRIDNFHKALAFTMACGVPLLLVSQRTREALARRSPLVFYTAAALVMAVLSCGPVLRLGTEPDQQVLLSTAPYAWLMALPGFMEIRVPLRFWMLGTMCLSIAAGLGVRALLPGITRYRWAILALFATGFLLDGWMPALRMADPPERWARVEPRDRKEPILELPIGPDWDYAATFRAVWHGRRVVNGVSGYNPPFYVALTSGLQSRDSATLAALASLGPLDIVVNSPGDPGGALERYVSGFPGAIRDRSDGLRTVYRIPRTAAGEPTLGTPLTIAHVETDDHDPDAHVVHDGRIETGWGAFPQRPGQWLVVDLGGVRAVGGVTHAIGEYLQDFPRRLAIETSVNEASWERVWEGPTFAPMFLASIRGPRETEMRFAFPPRMARFIKLLQLESYPSMWRVSELQIHAPK